MWGPQPGCCSPGAWRDHGPDRTGLRRAHRPAQSRREPRLPSVACTAFSSCTLFSHSTLTATREERSAGAFCVHFADEQTASGCAWDLPEFSPLLRGRGCFATSCSVGLAITPCKRNEPGGPVSVFIPEGEPSLPGGAWPVLSQSKV